MGVELLPLNQNFFREAIDLKLKISKLNRTFDDEKKSWDWKYLVNPYNMDGMSSGYVLTQQNSVVGLIGQFALPIKIGPRKTTGYAACDFFVDEDFRPYGLLLAGKFWGDTRPSVLFSTSVNSRSSNIHKKFGGKDLEIGHISTIRVIDYRKAAGVFFNYKKGILEAPSEITNSLSLSFLKSLFKYSFKTFPSELTVSPLNNFNKEFDEFWEENSDNCEVSVVRDKSYLTWRYSNYPLAGIKIFAAYDRNGRLSGFTVLKKSSSSPLCNITIEELFTRPDDYTVQSTLIKTAIDYSKKEAAVILAATNSNSSLNTFLQKKLFFEMKSVNSKYLYKFNGVPPKNNRWYTSAGDGDVAF